MATPEAAESKGEEDGSIVARVARDVVGIHARYYGRGPTKAKAVWRNGIIVVVLEEIFTKAEVVLVEADHFAEVRSHRQAFQDQVEPILSEAVENATGHPVRAFVSQVSPLGIAAEVFLLAENA